MAATMKINSSQTLRKDRPFLEIRDLSMDFVADSGHLHVLNHISFTVGYGEFISIIGPSGCGKTTLLYLIAGLYRPIHGKIILKGKCVNGKTGPDRVLVFQDYALFPWYTVYENIAYPLKLREKLRAETREKVEALVRFMGLHKFSNAYPSMLSGGMRQRTALARALVLEPQLLLLDEPFSSLDAQTSLILQEELLKIWQKSNKTILLVTHSIEEALFFSDRIMVLTARPARVKEIVQVPPTLGRSRRSSRDIEDLKEHIWDLLRPEAKKALKGE